MSKILWIDMEMTGLDVAIEVPIEIAALVTDFSFAEVEEYHAVIYQSPEILDRMDDWNKQHHGASGLTAQVASGKAITVVENELLELVGRHFSDPAVIAGNSIGQDRLFINKYLPRLASKLHYRMLDVTSWKIIMNEKFKQRYEKKNAHRALDDIRESISELKYYLQFVSK